LLGLNYFRFYGGSGRMTGIEHTGSFRPKYVVRRSDYARQLPSDPAVWQKIHSFWSFIFLAGVFDAKVKVLSEAIKPTSRKRKCAKKACSRRRDPGVDLVAPRDEMLACKERLKAKAQAAPCLRRSLG
jgi:hypothetical protein